MRYLYLRYRGLTVDTRNYWFEARIDFFLLPFLLLNRKMNIHLQTIEMFYP